MNPRQKKFVKAYIATGNGAEAARQAGYSEKTARTQADALLTKPDIKAAIDEGSAKVMEKLDISTEALLKNIAEIAYDKNASNKDKLKANDMLLDRTIGKPKQDLNIVAETTVTQVSAEDVKAKLEEVRKKF